MKTFLIIWVLSFVWIMSIDSCLSKEKKWPSVHSGTYSISELIDYWGEKINDELIHINATLCTINDNMQRKP